MAPITALSVSCGLDPTIGGHAVKFSQQTGFERRAEPGEIAETAIGCYLKKTYRVNVVCMPEHKAANVMTSCPSGAYGRTAVPIPVD
jgi:hypothetical protein